jgi:hypothetical protein
MPWEDPDAAYAAQTASAIPVVPQEILAKKAKAAAKLYEEKVCSRVRAAKCQAKAQHRLCCDLGAGDMAAISCMASVVSQHAKPLQFPGNVTAPSSI